jgi:hypothetical protein
MLGSPAPAPPLPSFIEAGPSRVTWTGDGAGSVGMADPLSFLGEMDSIVNQLCSNPDPNAPRRPPPRVHGTCSTPGIGLGLGLGLALGSVPGSGHSSEAFSKSRVREPPAQGEEGGLFLRQRAFAWTDVALSAAE